MAGYTVNLYAMSRAFFEYNFRNREEWHRFAIGLGVDPRLREDDALAGADGKLEGL